MKFPLLRVVEDAVLVGGTAVTAWQTTGSAEAVVAAVAAAPALRSGLALVLSAGESSGVVEGLSILLRLFRAVRSAPPTLTTPEAFAPVLEQPALSGNGIPARCTSPGCGCRG